MKDTNSTLRFHPFFQLFYSQKGFTLIEILIVVALLAILAVVALLALNPAAAQDRARDASRLKDMTTWQSVVEQFVTDNPTATVNAISTANGGSNACGTAGWFGSDVCNYATRLPVDQSNKSTNYILTSGVATTGNVNYQIIIGGGLYRICARLQGKSNAAKMTSDGGNSPLYYEVYNNTTAATNCTF